MGPGVRTALVEKYTIYYRPAPGGVEIARVVHQARDLRSLSGKK